jgi:hypothetical protein
VKHCGSCGRDIPDSSTLCEPCAAWAEAHAAAPSAPGEASSPAKPSATAQSKRVSRRDLVVILAATAAGSLLTLGLLLTRGVPSAPVAAAQGNVAKPPRPVVAGPPRASAVTQAWSTQRRAYWTGNQRNSAAFELPAENIVPIWLNQVRPMLIVRCLSKRTEAFVFTGSALKIEPQTEDHTVSFRFDDEQATTMRWPDSAEHDALFAPDAAAFAQRLIHAHTLRFGYTPHNAPPVEAHFEVSGLGALIEPVAKECGWKATDPHGLTRTP